MLLMTSLGAGAQGFRGGIEAGLGAASATHVDGSARFNFHVGARGEYLFQSPEKGWYMASGIDFVSKPWSKKIKWSYTRDRSASQYYLDIPVMGGYRFKLSDDVSFMLETGPYVGVGLFGKYKEQVYYGTKLPEGVESGNCFGSNAPYSRFEVGWRLGAGVNLSRNWMLGIVGTYQFNSFDPADSKSHYTIGLNAGYMF